MKGEEGKVKGRELTQHSSFLLELGPLDERLGFGMTVDHTFVDLTRPVQLVVPHFEFDVGTPCLLVGFPSHPSLKHLSSSRNVPKEFLEEDVFVPDLVDTGKESDGSVEKVASVRDVSRFQFL